MKNFYTFSWQELIGKELISYGNDVYYTTAEPNLDEMKQIVVRKIGKPGAVIHISIFSRIDEALFNRFNATRVINS